MTPKELHTKKARRAHKSVATYSGSPFDETAVDF